jgi:Glycosyl hydrolases family 43
VTVQVEPLVTPRRLPRIRRPSLLAIVVVGLVGLYGFQYRWATARLNDTRAQLEAAQESLAAEETELGHVRHHVALTQGGIEEVRSEIELAVAARTWIDAVTANTLVEIASVDAARTETDTARLLVAANSNEALACFDGVAQAVEANRGGDDQTAISALQASAGHCTLTLAYATGARFPYDFADPFVLRAGDSYYGYSTNAGAGDIQVIRSADLVDWELVGNALAGLPSWAAPHATWAPAVLQRDGTYVVYYTVRDASSHRQCISRAVASTPAGPFRDDSTAPLVCQRDVGGSIDPSPFVDGDGRTYLLWKAEGLVGAAPTIWSQQLTADGLALAGTARQLLSVDRSFERGVVEAPTLVNEGGSYFLVYAAGDWNSRHYSTAYATCAGPIGPCSKPVDGRVLTSGPRLAGPGGVELFRDHGGALWAAFHAFSEPNVGYPSSRYFHIAPVRVVGGRIVIDAPT